MTHAFQQHLKRTCKVTEMKVESDLARKAQNELLMWVIGLCLLVTDNDYEFAASNVVFIQISSRTPESQS